MSLRRWLILVLVLFTPRVTDVSAKERAELQAALDAVLDNDATTRRAMVALKVVDLETGEVLYDRLGEKLFTPASNLKIYTSACALDLFGPEHVFPTRIVGALDENSGVIQHDLKLIGGGNAMLSSADLKRMADQLVNVWKVRTIQGGVVVDNTRYSVNRLGPGWMWDDQAYYYNMQVTPLMVDFNARILPGKFDADGDPSRVAMADSPVWIASEFAKLLRERGVKIGAEQTNATAGVEKTLVFEGTKLAEALKHFNHKSENAVGEVLLHEIAIAKGHKRPSWPKGAQEISAWLHRTAGLESGSFKLVDGSGLSRYNLISADSSVKLLAFMRKHRHYETFYKSLPAYEVETPNGEKAERVRAKPGGMSSVSTISGYLRTLEDRQLAFSMLANGFLGSSKPVQQLRGKVWRVMVRHSHKDNG